MCSELFKKIKLDFMQLMPCGPKDIDCIDMLKKYNIHTLAPWLLKDLDPEISSKLKTTTLIFQSQYMAGLKKEFIQLAHAFNNHGLKVLCFKGFAISSDVYTEFPRIFTDNDFLCQEEDLPKIQEVLLQLGYKYSNLNPIDIIIPKGKDWFQTGFTTHRGSNNYSAEIHNRLMPVNMGISFDIDDVFSRARKTEIFGEEIYVMDIHDRIIFLILHFLKDYRYQINWMMQGQMEHLVDIRKLFDIALLLEKYRKEFSYKEFMELTLKMDIVLEINYVLRLMDMIFPGLIAEGFITKLSKEEYNQDRLMGEYLNTLIDCDVEKLMKFDIQDEIRKVIRAKNRTILHCSNEFYSLQNIVEKPVVITAKYPAKKIQKIRMKCKCENDEIVFSLRYEGQGNSPVLNLKFINTDHLDISRVIQNLTIELEGEDEGILKEYDYVTPYISENRIRYKKEIRQKDTFVQIYLHKKGLNTDSDSVIFNAMLSNVNPGVSQTDHMLFGNGWDDIRQCCILELNPN